MRLSALSRQSYPQDNWELIVVDNASQVDVATRFPLDWHPAGRHVGEHELGLIHARLRGISESKGDLIVFVDDDNVLAPNFLFEAGKIGAEYPFLGVWGGSIRAEFELQPPDWTKEFWSAPGDPGVRNDTLVQHAR